MVYFIKFFLLYHSAYTSVSQHYKTRAWTINNIKLVDIIYSTRLGALCVENYIDHTVRSSCTFHKHFDGYCIISV